MRNLENIQMQIGGPLIQLIIWEAFIVGYFPMKSA